MKNIRYDRIIGMVILFLLLFGGCTTTTTTPIFYSNNSNYEFIILGEVIYQNSTRFGFQELLNAARSKYPNCDYVIDVMVDSETKTTSFFTLQTYKTTYTMRGTAIQYSSRDNLLAFPQNFYGTWKRDNFDNTLTFTTNSIKSSSQSSIAMNLNDVSGDLYTLAYSNNNRTFTITIKFVNNNIEISGGTGSGQGNWNGIWKKQ